MRGFRAATLVVCLAWAFAPRAAPTPARIVTLAPHLTELVFAAGAGERLVGVSSYSDFPDEAKRLPVISDDGRVNIERVMRLKPDVILAWRSGMQAAQWRELERRGIDVVVTDAENLEDVPRLLRDFGKRFGTTAIAESAARRYETELEALRSQYEGAEPVMTFVEIWPSPLMTVNDDHLISKLLGLCGGRNVFASLKALTPTVSVEQLYRLQPALILSSVSPADLQTRWAAYPRLNAVRSAQVRAVDAALLTRMGPRVPQAARQVCERIASARPGNQ